MFGLLSGWTGSSPPPQMDLVIFGGSSKALGFQVRPSPSTTTSQFFGGLLFLVNLTNFWVTTTTQKFCGLCHFWYTV